MTDEKLAKLYETQKSLTEWLEDINHKDARAIRLEDNDKRERLKTLKNIIGLPFDEPVKFEASDVRDNTDTHKQYVQKHGDELCALRLIPKKSHLPKLRLRGETVAGVHDWFTRQQIQAEDYRAEYVPHCNKYLWSTIFVVNRYGIHGEIITGGHYQLTQGFYDKTRPIIFDYNFKQWELSSDSPKAKKHLQMISSHLLVNDSSKRKQITKELSGKFSHNYLTGYFETVYSEDFGLWFVDYNQSLGEMYGDFKIAMPAATSEEVKGMVGCPGKAEGQVQIVNPDNIDDEFPAGSVLVCSVTTPEYVPLMQKAVAIVTDKGGILSHAAIVARELNKPCIVGTGNATTALNNGQRIIVDADAGYIIT